MSEKKRENREINRKSEEIERVEKEIDVLKDKKREREARIIGTKESQKEKERQKEMKRVKERERVIE